MFSHRGLRPAFQPNRELIILLPPPSLTNPVQPHRSNICTSPPSRSKEADTKRQIFFFRTTLVFSPICYDGGAGSESHNQTSYLSKVLKTHYHNLVFLFTKRKSHHTSKQTTQSPLESSGNPPAHRFFFFFFPPPRSFPFCKRNPSKSIRSPFKGKKNTLSRSRYILRRTWPVINFIYFQNSPSNPTPHQNQPIHASPLPPLQKTDLGPIDPSTPFCLPLLLPTTVASPSIHSSPKREE